MLGGDGRSSRCFGGDISNSPRSHSRILASVPWQSTPSNDNTLTYAYDGFVKLAGEEKENRSQLDICL